MKENKYTSFIIYFAGLAIILILNFLLSWATQQSQTANKLIMFLMFAIPLIQGLVIGLSAITVYKLQIIFNNKYLIYLSVVLFGMVVTLPTTISGFIKLYLGATAFAALVGSNKRDKIISSMMNKKSKKKNKRK
ncbi:hypothetical protein [Peptoniphilus asaccharolyticus]